MRGKKLTVDQVIMIKQLLTEGYTQRSLAIRFDVSTTAIGRDRFEAKFKDSRKLNHGG